MAVHEIHQRLNLDATPEPTRAQRAAEGMRVAMSGRFDLPDTAVYGPPSDGYFGGSPTQTEPDLDFLPAPDLQRLGNYLIGECPELGHLLEPRVVYLWRRAGGTSQGRMKLGACVKPSGLVKHFAEATWIVWLAADNVRDLHLTRRQVEALLFHELLHAGEGEPDDAGNAKPKLIGHDFEDFGLGVQRYGAWSADLQLAQKAFVEGGKQLGLFEDAGDDDEGEEAE